MRKKYPSDVSRDVFEKKAQPVLQKAKKRTKPTTLDLYEVFCAILYVLKSGCQWRMLPDGFPKWESCYALQNGVGHGNAGLLSGLLPGLKNAVDFGKTANANSIPAFRWLLWLSALYSSTNRKRVLKEDHLDQTAKAA